VIAARMASLPPPPDGPDPTRPLAQTPCPIAGSHAGASGIPPPPSVGGQGWTRGPIRLEPMGAGQTIDGAIKLYRARWKTLMAIAALISVPFTVLQNYLIHISTHPVSI